MLTINLDEIGVTRVSLFDSKKAFWQIFGKEANTALITESTLADIMKFGRKELDCWDDDKAANEFTLCNMTFKVMENSASGPKLLTLQ